MKRLFDNHISTNSNSMEMGCLFLILSTILSVSEVAHCASYSYEITNYTGKSYNLDVVDKLEITFNKFRYNITAFVKVPLNDIMVKFFCRLNIKFVSD
jgi:hypothetical protein